MMDGVGDIWSTGAFSLESPLKDLLDSGDYTTEQLLEQDELLQELRGMHPTLVQFFSQEEQVIKLIQHIFKSPEQIVAEQEESPADDEAENNAPEEPPDDWEVSQRPAVPHNYTKTDVKVLRYPYVACEVICSEINSIVDTLVDGQAVSITQGDSGDEELSAIDNNNTMILDIFFDVLYSTKKGELDDYRAGYFDKIMAVLARKRPQAMSTYINEGGGRGRLVLIKATLQHLYSHSILQMTQRLLLPQPPEDENNQENWQKQDGVDDSDDEKELIFRSKWSECLESIDYLLSSLTAKSIEDVDDDYLRLAESQNASEVLITMIQNSMLTSPIMMRLTTDPCLGIITDSASCNVPDFSPHDNRLTCAMNVMESIVLQLGGYGSVNTILDMGQGDDDDDDNTNGHSIATAACLLDQLPAVLDRFNGLLRHESTKDWTSRMQFSNDPQPILGTSRLRIIRLIESLVLLGNAQVDALLCTSGILQLCLDLFWEFEWNSMLHQSVANLLVHVFEGANARAILQNYFVQDCNLLQRLVDSFDDEQVPGSPEAEEVQSNDDATTNEGENESVLPVSDDDIDAALEQEEQEGEGSTTTTATATDTATTEAAAAATTAIPLVDDAEKFPQNIPAQQTTSTRSLDLSVLKDMLSASVADGCDAPSHLPSLRKGYMGHVIIVCQALVHACTPSSPGTDDEAQNPEDCLPQEEDLIIASLIESHPMQTKWQDFVATTLASETAIQSTPLGGYHASMNNINTIDPLHSRRPGPDVGDFRDEDYDDDDDDGDVGDVIDMDDNDIEIAASMMDALSLPKRDFSTEFDTGGSGGGGEYMFDDPLGGGHGGQFASSNPGGGGDDDSSDEEEDTRRSNSDSDPPVMDLFAGNFAFDDANKYDSSNSPPNGAVAANGTGGGNWSADFANFDTFGGGASSSSDSGPVIEEDLFAMDSSDGSARGAADADDLFAAAPHPLLLDEAPTAPPADPPSPPVAGVPIADVVEEEMAATTLEEEEEIPQTSQYSYRRRDSEDSSSDEEDN